MFFKSTRLQSLNFSIRSQLSLIFLALVGFAAPGAEAATASYYKQQTQRFCQLIAQCGLQNAPQKCAAEPTAFKIDPAERCAAPLELERLGVNADSGDGRTVYSYLGHELQVVYDVAGRAKLGAPHLAYLLENLPLATKLLNRYADGNFAARIKRVGSNDWIYGSKGKRFDGRARLVAGDVRKGKAYYLGYGTAEVLNLDFHGKILLDLDFGRTPGTTDRLDYQITLYTAPQNRTLHTMMDSHVFHYFAQSMVESMIDDLGRATAKALNDYQHGGLDHNVWTAAERDAIALLARLA